MINPLTWFQLARKGIALLCACVRSLNQNNDLGDILVTARYFTDWLDEAFDV